VGKVRVGLRLVKEVCAGLVLVGEVLVVCAIGRCLHRWDGAFPCLTGRDGAPPDRAAGLSR
jgi:hypothetical protein